MERRAHPRVDVSHPVLYRSDLYPRPNIASTRNLSQGGSRIKIPYSLVAGEGLEVSIAIHPQVVRCRGKVVYVSWLEQGKMEAGIQFEKLSGRDSLYLRHYLSHLLEREV